MTTIESQIHQCGWELKSTWDAESSRQLYSASQGGFSTWWRSAPELVLADLRAMKEKTISEGKL